MKLSIGEFEIIKSALEQDILHQKKQLCEIGDDVRFEIWLQDTELLHKKVSSHLLKLKEVDKEWLKAFLAEQSSLYDSKPTEEEILYQWNLNKDYFYSLAKS